LHPMRKADDLLPDETARLYHAIRKVLAKGIRFRGTSLGTGEPNFHSVNRRAGQNQMRLNAYQRDGRPCPRCGTSIVRLTVGERGTHICPRCQVRRPRTGG
jgi:formamidopyrimidine-DNA glycosylase